jgi:hypothetical protein
MNACSGQVARLSLLIQRILDAEVLPDRAGRALMGATEAARQSLEEGDTVAARRYVEQVARSTEALVRAGAIDARDACAVMEATGRLLDAATG